jgi:hypothetical protein
MPLSEHSVLQNHGGHAEYLAQWHSSAKRIGPRMQAFGRLARFGYQAAYQNCGNWLKRLVDERGFEPPASSLRTVGKIS